MNVEHRRFSLHRLAPVALAALGIFGAVLMIFAGLVALNHSVLPFEGWPLNAQQSGTQRLTLPRAPAEAGRLRTGSGGTLARGVEGRVAILSPAATAAALGSAVTVTVTGNRPAARTNRSGRPQHQRSHSSLPAAPKPVVTPAPVVPAPAPVAAAPAPVAVTPVTHGSGHAFGHNKSRQPATSAVTTSPSRAPSAAEASTPLQRAPGNGHGKGHAYGHLKHQRPVQVPAPAAPPVPTPDVEGDSAPGNGHGHGPPPWAHGHGKD